MPNPLALEQIVESIGPKIRDLRAQQKLSLQQLAARAGVSAAAIHKVERGDMVPTITTLLKLATALGRPIGYFVDGAEPRPQVAIHDIAADRSPDTARFSGPPTQFALNGVITVIEPGASESREPARAPGGEEIVLLLDGNLEFQVADEVFPLARLDTLHYRTEHARRWTNRGRKPARAVWISLG